MAIFRIRSLDLCLELLDRARKLSDSSRASRAARLSLDLARSLARD